MFLPSDATELVFLGYSYASLRNIMLKNYRAIVELLDS